MDYEAQIDALKMKVAKLQEQVALLIRARRPIFMDIIAAESRSRGGAFTPEVLPAGTRLRRREDGKFVPNYDESPHAAGAVYRLVDALSMFDFQKRDGSTEDKYATLELLP